MDSERSVRLIIKCLASDSVDFTNAITFDNGESVVNPFSKSFMIYLN